MKIPKTNNKWIKLLDINDTGTRSLEYVIILNVFIKRRDRYHHGKSELAEENFGSIEFFYNSEMTAYYTYFKSHDAKESWNMDCIIEWLKISEELKS